MRVAVVGAAGYVGGFLVEELRRSGHDVVAVGRAEAEAARSGWSAGRVDAVVNLAHPKRGPAHSWPHLNREILALVERLAGDEARVVQACTLAVFGDALERPVAAEAVPPRRDLPYIECKLEMQDAMMARFARQGLHVVRLGHVWGPASPAWTLPLVHHLREGWPVAVSGEDGYSNVTDVANAASYLAFVAALPPPAAPRFHHLAELGHLRWSFFVQRLAAQLHVPPVLAPEQPPEPWRHGPLLARLIRGRRSGSYVRSLARRLPLSLVRRLRPVPVRALATPAPGVDPAFVRIMCCARRFECRIEQGFRPPVDAEASWDAVARWLQHDATP